MLLFVGWPPPSEYDGRMQEHLLRLSGELFQAGVLTGCVVGFPADIEKRSWLIAFLRSLRSAGIHHTSAMFSSSTLVQADLEDCRHALIDEVVIVQTSADPDALVRAVCECEAASIPVGVRVRIWLDPACSGSFTRTATTLRREFPSQMRVELAPYSIEEPAAASASWHDRSTPLACSWVDNALTLTDGGSLVPCPAHPPVPESDTESGPAEVLARIGKWRKGLGNHPLCAQCDRVGRSRAADTIKPFPWVGRRATALPTPGEFADLIGGAADSTSQTERKRMVADFLRRVRISSRNPS